MDNILLSIIIPVYNVEKYIKRCLDSILCQETENYEVILVDDGSTDSSGIICDSYAKCRKNVVCIHKTNGGLSDARNEGLKHCKGKYVWFVDSDDYITEDALESLEKVLCKYSSDVVVCMSKTIDDYGKIQDECHYEIPSGLYSSHEYMEMLRKYPQSVLLCAQFHVVKKTFVDKHCFSFRKNILHEDELWTPQLLMNAEQIYYSNLNIYFHYMREGSIMHSSNMEKSGRSDLIVTNELKKIYDNSGRSDLYYLRDHMVDTYLQAVWKLPDFLSTAKWKRSEPWRNAYYPKTRVKSLLYFVSPKMYLWVHERMRKV